MHLTTFFFFLYCNENVKTNVHQHFQRAGAPLIIFLSLHNLPHAWQHVEEAQQERRELLKAMRLLQEEKQQLQEEQKRLAREREQERETCCLLRTHNQVRE